MGHRRAAMGRPDHPVAMDLLAGMDLPVHLAGMDLLVHRVAMDRPDHRVAMERQVHRVAMAHPTAPLRGQALELAGARRCRR
jgi:hypothetical protein